MAIQDRTMPCERPGCTGRVFVNNDRWHLAWTSPTEFQITLDHMLGPDDDVFGEEEYDW